MNEGMTGGDSTLDFLQIERPAVFPQSNEPTISVIAPSMNGRRFLPSTLASIARQDFPDFECIVVDGGSQDGTLEYLGACTHLRWVSEPDEGYVDALFKGLEMAEGGIVAQCCVSDGYLAANWLSACAAVFQSRPEVSLVFGMQQRLNASGQLTYVSGEQFFDESGSTGYRQNFFNWLTRGFRLPEGNLCVRKDVFLDCMPSRKELPGLELDPYLEFNLRFFRKGYMAIGLPVVASFGREHGDSVTASRLVNGLDDARGSRLYRASVGRDWRSHILKGRRKVFVRPDHGVYEHVRYSLRERLSGSLPVAIETAGRVGRPALGILGDSMADRLLATKRALVRPWHP